MVSVSLQAVQVCINTVEPEATSMIKGVCGEGCVSTAWIYVGCAGGRRALRASVTNAARATLRL
ncbi:uncharacterized protein CC84DRAFT_274746 [Paraphaeosphaeria sporulosa]|uniref:Uncharacterized protein n=1 Tax=Paraphaeosphaeria sporulosa TaxID=1460663 RepID=A0A177C289_9PLEO|nr:uncharacterized protein CC84DRAFT_274746 [Paraphaeosphaeria sporulosa]OAG01009.1 hypothetical protein CC84DRAFT_274746 [Paraphaeosphaeria sporulosa]